MGREKLVGRCPNSSLKLLFGFKVCLERERCARVKGVLREVFHPLLECIYTPGMHQHPVCM